MTAMSLLSIFRFVKLTGLALVLSITLALGGWLVLKQGLTAYSGIKARELVDTALQGRTDMSPDEEVTAITKEVHKNFAHVDPATIPVAKIRPFLTSERLPAFMRFKYGVVANLLRKGYCDGAARMLSFVLATKGYSSVQWNMVVPTTAHSALLVTMPDGRKVLADAFYGYVATDEEGRLASPQDAQERMKAGEKFDRVFQALSVDSLPDFYHVLADAKMSARGEPLLLESTLPPLNNKPLVFGAIDGHGLDVKQAAMGHNMTPFWNYMGHRYNREWVRVMHVTEPVKIIMTLKAPAEDGILVASPAPAVDGKTLTWTLKAGDELTLTDSKAKLSLRTMKSYIPIDQIQFYPLDPQGT
jgi:hypothetical protein